MTTMTFETPLTEVYKLKSISREMAAIIELCVPDGSQLLDKTKVINDLGPRIAYNTMISLNLIQSENDAGHKILRDLYSVEEVEADPLKGQAKLLTFFPHPGKPVCIVIPGGGYTNQFMCDSAGIPIGVELGKLGYNSAVLYHRCSEESGFLPAPVEDLAAAVKLLEKIIREEYGVETGLDYSVFGFSSGGHLAGLWGTDKWGYKNYGLPRPGALVCGFAPLSMSFWYDMVRLRMAPTRDLYKAGLTLKIVGGENYTLEDLVQFSPADQVTADYPPTYLIHGEADFMVYIRHSELMDAALTEKGVPHVFRPVPGAPHNFGKGHNTVADGWLADAVEFIKEARK